MAEPFAQPHRVLTEEDLALLGHSELGQDGSDVDHDELSYPAPAGFRDRLALGDLSW